MEQISQFIKRDGVAAESLGFPVVTISGKGEVCVENHRGISEYESGAITIRGGGPLASGRYNIRVTGTGLEIRSMSSDTLIISGEIDGVTL
jgi:sporulation protein YqfC